MSNLKIRGRIFFVVAAVMGLLTVPGNCFAQNITESESRVYRERLVAEAKKYVVVPYVRGATGPDAFDCSGLIFTVSHDSIAYQLPRTVKAIYGYVKIVPESHREPGDLVFFRTTGDGTISHVGLYIGKGQFISAVSDGPNTGVIVSSLRENYWKTHYASSGKFLPDAGLAEAEYAGSGAKAGDAKKAGEKNVWNAGGSSDSGSSGAKNGRGASGSSGSGRGASGAGAASGSSFSYSGNGGFTDHLAFTAYTTADWSLFTEKKFMPNFRGVSTEADVIYRGKVFSPGLGMIVRWNYGVKAFQLPLVASLYFGDYFRAYAGPLFSFGDCTSPDTDDEIKASVFPGVIGVTFAVPSFTKGNFKVQLIQDICYSVYNHESNAALSALKSASAGLEFCTGVRVMFPFSVFSK